MTEDKEQIHADLLRHYEEKMERITMDHVDTCRRSGLDLETTTAGAVAEVLRALCGLLAITMVHTAPKERPQIMVSVMKLLAEGVKKSVSELNEALKQRIEK